MWWLVYRKKHNRLKIKSFSLIPVSSEDNLLYTNCSLWFDAFATDSDSPGDATRTVKDQLPSFTSVSVVSIRHRSADVRMSA